MNRRLFDHIDLRVRNRAAAQRFYAQVLPAIGFRVDKSGEKWGAFEAAGETAVDFFGFTEEADHKPNGNRIAFWAASRAAVDKVAASIKEFGFRQPEHARGLRGCLDAVEDVVPLPVPFGGHVVARGEGLALVRQ